MPSRVPTHLARVFRHASDLPPEVWRALSQNEAAANVILPFARKALDFPHGDDPNEQLWIALFDGPNSVEFVLSCTQTPLGNYPIFIVSSKSSTQIAQDEKRGKYLADSLLPLVICLLNEVPTKRVFSVFSAAKVSEKFAEIFVAEAHARGEYAIQAHPTPYYDATFTYCTSETLKRPPDSISCLAWSEDVSMALCRADMSHLKGIAALCKAFSETSPPFVLDDEGAELEARMLVSNRKVWVHLVQQADQAPEIACLVATTRESDNVAAVTKVYTAEHWRGRGCAARLLYRVCEDILRKKKRAVLYVGNSDELAPARKVYDKIGFQGLRSPLGQVKDVEQWVEIGFQGTELGYW